jgi:hypothetical protein
MERAPSSHFGLEALPATGQASNEVIKAFAFYCDFRTSRKAVIPGAKGLDFHPPPLEFVWALFTAVLDKDQIF